MISNICAIPVFRTNLQNPTAQASGLNYNYTNPLNESKPNFLQKDVFQLQKKFNPAFGAAILQKGIIPAEEILKLCTTTKSLIHPNCVTSSGYLIEIARDFFRTINELTPCDKEIPQIKQIIFGYFQNILKNKITNTRTKISSSTINDITEQINEFKNTIKIIEEYTKKWATIEKDIENKNNITIKKLIGLIIDPSQSTKNSGITLKNMNLLKNTTINNPDDTLLSLMKVSQFMGHPEKTGIIVRIERVANDNVAPFHAVFSDSTANALSEDIINRTFNRKEDHPYREFVEILKKWDYKPTDLVENIKGKLRFRLPLIEVSKNSP